MAKHIYALFPLCLYRDPSHLILFQPNDTPHQKKNKLQMLYIIRDSDLKYVNFWRLDYVFLFGLTS